MQIGDAIVKFDVEYYEDYSFDDVSVTTVQADSIEEAADMIYDRFPNGYVRSVIDLRKIPVDTEIPF